MRNHNHFGPTAHITVDRKRLRQYDDAIYLNNGQEFEIEMFNPLSVSVKAEIHINGVKMNGGGIVIKPGQRIFLERHLDSPNKLVFETYEIESTSEALDAIVNNGDVVVKFYEEKHQNINYSGLFINPQYFGTLTLSVNGGTYNTTTGAHFTSNSSGLLSNNSTNTAMFYNNTDKSLETGRVEKGENSNQNFSYDYTSFSYTPRTIVSWKLLPTSVKPYDSKDLKKYCTGCGSKIKKESFKFCPNCGQKL